MSLDDQLVRIKKDMDALKVKKIQLAERLKTLDSEKEQLLQECKNLQVEPQQIERTIQELEQKLAEELNILSQTFSQVKHLD